MLKQRLLMGARQPAGGAGNLYAFGGNTFGQIGNGGTSNVTTPTKIGSVATWSKMFGGRGVIPTTAGSGSQFSLSIRSDGSLWATGSNESYATAQSVSSGNTTTWARIGSANNWVTAIACCGGNGQNWALGITSDGKLWGWGYNGDSQLAGLPNPTTVPTQIGSATNWVDVSSSGQATVDAFSVGITSDGKLWAWGSNVSGATCQGTTSGILTTVTQVGSNTTWKQVSAGGGTGIAIIQGDPTGFILATRTDGSLWGCGINANANIDNTGTNYTSVVQIGSATDWNIAIAGNACGMAIKTNQTLYSWGANSNGRTAQGTTSSYTTAPTIVGSNTWSMVSLDGGGSSGGYGVGITTDGKLWTWGVNSVYNLGNGSTSPTNFTSPTQVGSKTDWINASAGGPNFAGSNLYTLAVSLT